MIKQSNQKARVQKKIKQKKKKKRKYYMLSTRHSTFKKANKLKVKGQKKILRNSNHKKARMAILVSDKTDFYMDTFYYNK